MGGCRGVQGDAHPRAAVGVVGDAARPALRVSARRHDARRLARHDPHARGLDLQRNPGRPPVVRDRRLVGGEDQARGRRCREGAGLVPAGRRCGGLPCPAGFHAAHRRGLQALRHPVRVRAAGLSARFGRGADPRLHRDAGQASGVRRRERAHLRRPAFRRRPLQAREPGARGAGARRRRARLGGRAALVRRRRCGRRSAVGDAVGGRRHDRVPSRAHARLPRRGFGLSRGSRHLGAGVHAVPRLGCDP